MTSDNVELAPFFFPKADATVLSSRCEAAPARPQTVWPVFDEKNLDKPLGPWPSDMENFFYPPKPEPFAAASIPEPPSCPSDRYMRAFLAKNERLRSSMLWYYTRNILNETELLAGLQEKAFLAQESTDWEFAVIGILDVNYYICLATVGLPLTIMPRGETICAHTVSEPPGSVFLLPSLMEDWRFKYSPYVESGGLRAYAGVPLRLQDESGDTFCLGSLCVCSKTSKEPLTRLQQQTLTRLADWVVSDIVKCARARRQRERRQMLELITAAQLEADELMSQEPVLNILKATYGSTEISLQSSCATHIQAEGRGPIPLADIKDGLWEDVGYLDDFIAKSNQREFPSNRVVRALAVACDIASGPALLVVATKDFRRVFDDIDSWFTQTCAKMLSQIWHKQLVAEVIRAKEKFLRTISHQLRTPIHGILGSVELLAEELMSVRKLRENTKAQLLPMASVATDTTDPQVYLETIKSAGRDLMSIVNNMITLNHWADVAVTERDYAVCTPYELEAALAKDIDKATLGETRYKPATVFFNHNHPPDCGRLRTDLGLLRESLLPLILNAIQNTPAGIVMISTSFKVDSKELVVDVEDTGCGIQPDDQERIFEPYEKFGECATGAGLGLTLASKFATLLHGSVSLVASTVNHGSHFQVVFEEVDFVRSTPASHQTSLAGQLSNAPSLFHVMSTSNGTALCDYFVRFLTENGFEESASVDSGSLILFDYEDDWDRHRLSVSKVLPGHVAICLIPTSVSDNLQHSPPGNIIYLRGPFSSSTLADTLGEFTRRREDMTSSDNARLHQADASSPVPRSPSLPDSDTEAASSTTSLESTSPASADKKGLHLPSTCATISVPPEATLITPLTASLTVSRPVALLVDDNVVNLRIMQMYCKKRKLPYHCAADGAQAVAIFSQQQSLMAASGGGQGIQLIFMDLQMPVCDGFEATRQIRQLEREHQWTESTIFIVTGQDSPSDRKTADKIGAHEYFVKPVGTKVLDAGVKRYYPCFDSGIGV
ncbi:hypothetical protein E4U42_000828 [Claviceps africana]|uniref:histidine kinase n=1 Tax=Claviceps africana TaxID=83212 RepID=A0A8K0JAA8_9HYPO|nr:hypothetical protein E4U42_000828 [Claviceps africana]